MTEKITDQRAECHRDPKVFVSLDELAKVNVLYFHIPVENYKEGLAKICETRGYNYQDEILVNREKLLNYDEKIRNFFEEHLHVDEEVRYITAGSGYFDVRNQQDEWIRILSEPGDLIIIPAGIYHRFTVTEKDFIQAIRLFKDKPIWTPFNRTEKSTESLDARRAYLKEIISN